MNRQLVFAGTWLVGVAAVCIGGLFPDEYREHVLRLPGPHPYPLHGVMQFALMITVESVLLWSIIRPLSYRGSWARALTAALVFLPVTLYFGTALMHAPWYQYMHFVWSAVVSAALVVAVACSVIASVRRRHGA